MSAASSTTAPPAQLAGLPLACACCRLADEKQAGNMMILDLRGLSQLCDFFVLCTGNSLPHLRAIRDEIAIGLTREHDVRANHRDGLAESQWMILDFIDVVVHVFDPGKRDLYSLEGLWADAPRIDWTTGEVVMREEPVIAEEARIVDED
ncbi:MAG: ribosome-associated protein [Verrucomicrobiales bacterium]|jgi:ribosome-associated protein